MSVQIHIVPDPEANREHSPPEQYTLWWDTEEQLHQSVEVRLNPEKARQLNIALLNQVIKNLRFLVRSDSSIPADFTLIPVIQEYLK